VVLVLPIAMSALHLSVVHAQDSEPRFEVASVKPNDGCENSPRFGNLSPSPGRLELPCATLQNMIQQAYGTFADGATINLQQLRTEGGPSWMQSDHYSVSAKAEGPARTEMLAGPMLRSLLEERFQLKTHRETRELPVYAMTVGKGGLKMQRLADGACTPIDLAHPPPLPKGDSPPNVCGVMRLGPTGRGEIMLELRGSTMTQFAQRMSGFLDRAVSDKTGITGLFNFHLEFTPDPNMPGQALPGGRGNAGNPAPPPIDAGPTLFAALQEQIGVKLSSDKGPVSFLVIDHVQKPTAN
jgi:uncharacterized protein (TIGR03435 family)